MNHRDKDLYPQAWNLHLDNYQSLFHIVAQGLISRHMIDTLFSIIVCQHSPIDKIHEWIDTQMVLKRARETKKGGEKHTRGDK